MTSRLETFATDVHALLAESSVAMLIGGDPANEYQQLRRAYWNSPGGRCAEPTPGRAGGIKTIATGGVGATGSATVSPVNRDEDVVLTLVAEEAELEALFEKMIVALNRAIKICYPTYRWLNTVKGQTGRNMRCRGVELRFVARFPVVHNRGPLTRIDEVDTEVDVVDSESELP